MALAISYILNTPLVQYEEQNFRPIDFNVGGTKDWLIGFGSKNKGTKTWIKNDVLLMNNYLDTMVSTIIPIFLIYRLELNYKCEKRPAGQEQWGVKKTHVQSM